MFITAIDRRPRMFGWLGKWSRRRPRIFRVPTSWAEVDRHAALPLLYAQAMHRMGADLARCTARLLPFFIPARWLKFYTVDQLRDILAPQLQFIAGPVDARCVPFLKVRRTIRIRIAGRSVRFALPFPLYHRRLYLPAPLLSDVTGAEFAAAMKQLMILHNRKGDSTGQVERFLGIVCRPGRPDLGTGEMVREKFTGIDGRDQLLAGQPDVIKSYVQEYFLQQLAKLKTAPKLQVLFPEPEGRRYEDGVEGGHDLIDDLLDPNTWADFLISMSEAGSLGNLDEVEGQPIQTILAVAAKKKQDSINAKMQADAARTG